MNETNSTNMDDQDKFNQMVADMAKQLHDLVPLINDYAAMGYRTPEEEAEFQELVEMVKEGLPLIQQALAHLGEKLYRHSVAYFYEIKEKAMTGDEKALAIYNELAPEFGQALMSHFDKN